jgi:FAD/FMN-containing dehydrogenase
MNVAPLRTLDGSTVDVPAAALDGLAGRLRGRLVTPDDDGYAAALTVWNGMIGHRPALVLAARGAADVAAGVRFAAEHGLVMSVKSGGHNIAGGALADGGLTLDLSAMRAVRVDPAARRAWVEPGNRWFDVDQETQAYGLAVPGGLISTTGVAGLTLGGGFGWLTRRHGLTSDNLLAADVVTADGRLVRASAEENADLFWALRGGGGNLGVVTGFELALHPVGPTVAAGMILFPHERGGEVARFFRDWTADAPDDLCAVFLGRTAPAAPFLPAAVHGKPIVGVAACWAGDPQEGLAALAPLRALDGALADLFAEKPYRAHQQALDAGQPTGSRYYWKSEYADALPDALLDALVDGAGRFSSPLSSFLLMHLGGAARRVADPTTAAPLRDAEYVVNLQGQWKEAVEDERHVAWTRHLWQAIRPHSTGTYGNFLPADETGEDRAAAAYGAALPRLVEVKRRWDPRGLFRAHPPLPLTVPTA